MNDNRFALARRATTIVLLALSLGLARPTEVSASQVHYQRLEEVAGSTRVVLRVRVLEANPPRRG